jgi:hypothetical protein
LWLRIGNRMTVFFCNKANWMTATAV